MEAAQSEGTTNLCRLGPKYRRQVRNTYCGVATLATAWDLLNDLGSPGTLTPEDAIFEPQPTDLYASGKRTSLVPEVVQRRGMTLDELHSV